MANATVTGPPPAQWRPPRRTGGSTPTSLPPSGGASGDLSGTYPGPTVVKASGDFSVGGHLTVANGAELTTGHLELKSINSYFMNSSGLAKSRLGEFNAGIFEWRTNLAPGPVQDDPTKSSWTVTLDTTTNDLFRIQHRLPGGGVTIPLQITGSDGLVFCALSGNSTAKSGFMFEPLCRVTANTTLTQWGINNTSSMPGYDQTLAGWSQTSYTQVANPWWQIHYRAANQAGLVKYFEIRGDDGQVSIPVNSGLEVSSAVAKTRLQSTGPQGGVYVNRNMVGGSTFEDATKAGYSAEARLDLDQYLIRRAAPGSTSSLTLALFDGASAGNLQIFGAVATKASGTAWANPSDVRMKRNVVDYTTGLPAVCGLRPVSFEYNGAFGSVDDGRTCYGFLAQEVARIMPECVGTMEWTPTTEPDEPRAEPTTVLTLDQSNITLALVNAVQELATRVATLELARGIP